ncbi:3D domain-containing protein [Maribacter polysiphoniae]|uniref:3D (Asp-Asp-Asp) domain-containing protein n=1 Tax=Maribacter polysiphoniae TaxID=429344 RepID=A0A316DV79_9FLAO|nr:3D domain-containing protein [Maribacter polysiphoniae]MBD1262420.1 3D domain-containing protein [Maribacter polysiphoniae]PWK21252.1 3D (Asp-Asp-Asp) domain-containing protein [Maribacter polysiphoniae]
MSNNKLIGFLIISIFWGCKEDKEEDPYVWIPLEVTATAYNSLPSQTNEAPTITAWGDTLKPGVKSLAVSRDLIAKGLKYGTMVRIDTFPDTFYINDKMHPRWKNKIDIYMGKQIDTALNWGKRKIIIEYAVLKEKLDSLPLND